MDTPVPDRDSPCPPSMGDSTGIGQDDRDDQKNASTNPLDGISLASTYEATTTQYTGECQSNQLYDDRTIGDDNEAWITSWPAKLPSN